MLKLHADKRVDSCTSLTRHVAQTGYRAWCSAPWSLAWCTHTSVKEEMCCWRFIDLGSTGHSDTSVTNCCHSNNIHCDRRTCVRSIMWPQPISVLSYIVNPIVRQTNKSDKYHRLISHSYSKYIYMYYLNPNLLSDMAGRLECGWWSKLLLCVLVWSLCVLVAGQGGVHKR